MFLRKQFLTHKSTQIKLASVFLLWFMVFVALFGFIYFTNFSSFTAGTEGLHFSDELLIKMLLIQQGKELTLYYGMAALGYIALVWLYMIVYSHRLTGPIYKMTRILKNATHNKDWPEDLKFRKNDAFSELAKAFNEYVAVMKNSSSSQTTHQKDQDT